MGAELRRRQRRAYGLRRLRPGAHCAGAVPPPRSRRQGMARERAQGAVGLIASMAAVFKGLDPEAYKPHALHDSERMWPETNCYIDLWIEVLSTLNLPPEAMLGFTMGQDFEGDQFTFFKVP